MAFPYIFFNGTKPNKSKCWLCLKQNRIWIIYWRTTSYICCCIKLACFKVTKIKNTIQLCLIINFPLDNSSPSHVNSERNQIPKKGAHDRWRYEWKTIPSKTSYLLEVRPSTGSRRRLLAAHSGWILCPPSHGAPRIVAFLLLLSDNGR